MSNVDNIKIIPSTLRYESAPEIEQTLTISFEQKQELFIEVDRSSSINLAQVYDNERQASTIFRPTAKLNFLFENVFYGTTQYKPFENQLYYYFPELSLTNLSAWSGFPQYQEFSFIRNDVDIPNYTTQGTNPPHVDFVTKSASSYNWSIYLSYPYKNNYTKTLQHYDGNLNITWTAQDGIPFYITNTILNGSNYISFVCPMNHGLSENEFVELSISYNGTNVFQVSYLGDESFGSELYIFNIENIGYTGNTFANGVKGTFKRIIDINYSGDTKSEYYVREHKILTEESDTILVKSGFELSPFNTDRKYEYSALTPNNIGRISEKDGNQTYTLTFKKDIDINGMLDNQKRPLTELYVTIINKGYFGWFNFVPIPNSPALKFGYEFNILKNPTQTNPWWSNTNQLSWTNIPTKNYTRGGFTFNYNDTLPVDFTLDGDFCEFNNTEQTERIISRINHKLRYNPAVFRIQTNLTPNPPGYYYQVHHPITLRVFSNYVETATIEQIDAAPNWSYFSDSQQSFLWRDIYTYGFVDDEDNGVDYPFINGSHYPYGEIFFRLSSGYEDFEKNLQLIVQPKFDRCA